MYIEVYTSVWTHDCLSICMCMYVAMQSSIALADVELKRRVPSQGWIMDCELTDTICYETLSAYLESGDTDREREQEREKEILDRSLPPPSLIRTNMTVWSLVSFFHSIAVSVSSSFSSGCRSMDCLCVSLSVCLSAGALLRVFSFSCFGFGLQFPNGVWLLIRRLSLSYEGSPRCRACLLSACDSASDLLQLYSGAWTYLANLEVNPHSRFFTGKISGDISLCWRATLRS